ncbi:MAG: tRNA (adenosine(37)-N6)-threonylcarbamoyltransferase complex ATPase subunit type 1 TsaE [Desulfobacterales bacterium]|nr:tRNA (adenosine(37)-N6)-threonylcarbamoyltransferase complex ATPase subunit type 1 TsaE [Desulfobacterales bacterium]MDJ0886754.1 tRNA (adenosine(37)-N6)-threonylcarbamoyltransferase complex ATPase subunit type 1 TsaE [Desulfobacterales bacterium]
MQPEPSLQLTIDSDSPDATRRIGARIGRRATPGLVLAIEGDLGSGKTCLVQGLACGLGVPAEVYVTSPSYTLVNSYEGRLPLHHVDLYRLAGCDLEDIGLYDLMVPPAVTAIEWPERMAEDRPAQILTVRLQVVDDDRRRLILTGCGLEGVNLIRALDKTDGE